MALLCPKCHKDDQIRKASAIVNQGTNIGTAYNPSNPYQGRVSVTSSSELVKSLLYDKPVVKSTWGALSCLAMAFFVIGGFLLAIVVVWMGMVTSQSRTTSNVSFFSGGLISVVVFGGLTLMFFVIQAVRSSRNERQWRAAYAQWQNDFDRRYYCFRDGLVFYS